MRERMAGATLTLARNMGAWQLPAGNILTRGSAVLSVTGSRRAVSSVPTQLPTFCFLSAPAAKVQFRSASSESAALAKAMAGAARPLVVCGPSGVGKSTLIGKLTGAFPDAFGFSVSHTTRRPREGERDGVNYHYVKKMDFEAAKERGEFIESAEFSGNLYGTSRGAVSGVQRSGKICILDIDMQGVIQLKNIAEMNPHYVFIRPPSMEELEKRLRDRCSDPEESIQKRLTIAREEMEYGSDPANFDKVVVNADVEAASKELIDFMAPHVEEVRRLKELMSKK